MAERQIVLDTETTGIEITQGHRIIEIGCVELVNRRITANAFHHYVNPERDIDRGALEVHGITREFLLEKPRFAEVARNLLEFVRGAELLIHNADFDVGFLNAELARAGIAERIDQICTVTDTIALARKLHPGQKAGLDALCKRYSVDNSGRELHGAQLDARLLAEVYLAMTGGQGALLLDRAESIERVSADKDSLHPEEEGSLVVLRADEEELVAHRERLKAIAKKGKLQWETDLPAVAAQAA